MSDSNPSPDPEPTPDPAAKPTPQPADETPAKSGGGGGFIKFLFTLVILGILGFLAWKFLLKRDPVVPVETAPAAVAEQVAKVNNATAVATLQEIIKESNSTVNSIKDVESARAALPALDAITKKTAAVGGLFKGAPDSLKSELQALIVEFAPGFTNKLEKAAENPGVEEIVEGPFNRLIEKFELFEL